MAGVSKIESFLKKQHIAYKKIDVYVEAFTHTSYSNEQRHRAVIAHNERLEFLGDAALELCCSTYLFGQKPELPEGQMTITRSNLVREEALVKYADFLELAPLLRMGRGEEKMGGRDRASLKANAFEALLGAIYMDLGFEATWNFVAPILERECANGEEKRDRDFKSKLQEFVQADSKRAIVYELLSAEGPAHARIFETAVKLDDVTLGYGSATSKKESEQRAAEEALEKLAIIQEK